ncbi:MAG: hypothetical protein LAN63_15000 [Acidobacteriia bacterium]|nr:hypothetical protein [Terriglobia bacterium]
MKCRFAPFIVFATSLAASQTIVDRTYVMRAETTTVDPYSGMSHMCVLIYPDGHYRLEKSFQSNNGGSPDERVYLDTLPEASMKQLQATLDDEKFQAVKTAEPKGGIVQDMDTLSVSVPREHLLQNISFMNARERKPFEKELKSFQEWLKALQKRKVPVAKNESANNCAAPG